MLDTFLATVSSMMVMLLCIVTGYILRKSRLLPENTASVLSKLVLYAFAPAQIISAFVKNCTLESIQSEYQLVLYGCVAVALGLAIGIPLSGLFSKDQDERNIYRYALVFANCGYLGNAVVELVLGQSALYLYILFNLPLNMVIYTWGFRTLTPVAKRQKQSFLKSLLQPSVIAMAVGMSLGLSGIGKMLPEFVGTTLGNLAGCMGPAAMLLTGFTVGGFDFGGLFRNKKVYIATALRLLVLPSVMVAALYLLGADKQILILAMVAFGAALGLNTVVIPAAYDGDTHTGAAMAMISHMAAVVTIPLMYALLNWIL